MIADPENLGCGEAGQSRVCCDLDQTLCTNLLGDLLAFLLGTLIAPDNGRTDNLTGLVKHNKSVHLSGNTKTLDVVSGYAGIFDNLCDCLQCSVTPVFRLLLCPSVVWSVEWIILAGRGDHGTFLIKENCLGRGST